MTALHCKHADAQGKSLTYSHFPSFLHPFHTHVTLVTRLFSVELPQINDQTDEGRIGLQHFRITIRLTEPLPTHYQVRGRWVLKSGGVSPHTLKVYTRAGADLVPPSPSSERNVLAVAPYPFCKALWKAFWYKWRMNVSELLVWLTKSTQRLCSYF